MVNKTTIILITILSLFVIYLLFSKRECASCTYINNNRDYAGYCPEMCFGVPKWKIILFEITGNNFGYKK